VRWASGDEKPVRVTPTVARGFLGIPRFHADEALRTDQAGAATGLAWTASGGDVMIIEARSFRGKGRLQLTGQLGDVMRESAQAGIKTVVLPRLNQRDLADVPEDLRRDLRFVFVNRVEEVLDTALNPRVEAEPTPAAAQAEVAEPARAAQGSAG